MFKIIYIHSTESLFIFDAVYVYLSSPWHWWLSTIISQMSVASSIAMTKMEKLLLAWKAATECKTAGSKRLKLQLNRKYNSLYPVLEIEEE